MEGALEMVVFLLFCFAVMLGIPFGMVLGKWLEDVTARGHGDKEGKGT